jgi:branched-chain amino acid transport system substrate-binding protein
VLARWLSLAALALAIPALAGCGGVAVSSATEATGSQLAIYSSLPLQGPAGVISQQLVNGEKLALSQAQGRAGRFTIGYVLLDDAETASGLRSPGAAETNAKTAAQDTSTIAYLGDYGSAATAVSLPLTNAAGILQISPSSPYVGLTSSEDAGQDEPERFYPSGHRTFGRLQPGDIAQAEAQVQLMKSLGVHKLFVLDNQEPFEMPLAEITASDAEAAGIVVAAHDSVATSEGSVFAGEIEKIVKSGAQAVFLAGRDGSGTVSLWRQLHSAEPRLLLSGSSSMVSESFTSQIGAAGDVTYLTNPVLPVGLYPPSAQRVLSAYRRTFGSAGGPYALYGYESMSVVLDAIRSAGVHGNDRQAVIDRFFATRNRDSVIGRYSIEPNGETTLSRYGVDRVVDGHAVFFRAFDTAAQGSPSGG